MGTGERLINFAEVNDVFDTFKAINFEGCTFEGVKIAELQNFIFPGSATLFSRGSTSRTLRI